MGLRVLRVITRLNAGGPLRQLEALVPALARRGVTGPIVHGQIEPGEGDGAARLERAGAELLPLPGLCRGLHPGQDLRALRGLLERIRSARPDLIHTHLGKAGALGRWAAHRLGLPAVHTFHGHHFDAGSRLGAALRLAERRLGAWTTRAIALSPRQRRDLVEIHRILPAQRVRVVPPGLDLEAVRAQGRTLPSPSPSPPTLVWSGRLVPAKRPLLAVEAAERLGPGVRTLLLGQGPLLGRVRRHIQRRGLLGRVEAVGAVPEPVATLRGARALFLTSVSEGTPLVVLEAFAVGVPVVVPTVGGLPDLVEHGVSGLWVPPGDGPALAAALRRLLEDEPLRARLARGAAEAAAAYGGDALGERTAALYQEALAAGPG